MQIQLCISHKGNEKFLHQFRIKRANLFRRNFQAVFQMTSAAKVNRRQKQRFIHLTAKLDALSPLKVLARGYSVVLTSDGRVVQRAGQVQIGDQVDIKLHQGSFTASVTQIQEERNGEEITEL